MGDPICGWCADGLCEGDFDACTFRNSPFPCACECNQSEKARAMTFQVPASKASIGQNTFEFTIGKDKFKVKRAKFLSVGDAEALETPENVSVVLDLFGARGTKQGNAVRALDSEQFQALVSAWQEDSDVTLGESEASAS